MSSSSSEWPGRDKFAAVQELLDRNKLLIAQINANHGLKTVDSLTHNKVLLKELNTNVAKVVELYRDLGEAMPLEEAAQQQVQQQAIAGAVQPTQL